MTSTTVIRSMISVLLIAFLVGLTSAPEPDSTVVEVASVTATGPEVGQTLEDRVEIMWTVDAPIASTSSFHITRRQLPSGTEELIRVAAPSVSIYQDMNTIPDVDYEYCVYVDMTTPGARIGCDLGGRLIAPPTGFDATDGLYEDYVLLTWTDRSEIEAGFNIYREGGRALNFDGIDDYVGTQPIITSLSNSFSFEFWAKRNSLNTDDFVVNVEKQPNGDPVNVDLEVGFSNGRFQFRFGVNTILEVPGSNAAYNDLGWHHWAIAYDGPNLRRFIYLDGVRVATDVLGSEFHPSGDLEFGRRDRQGSSENRGHFHGQIDEIRYWNIALTESQVASRMLTMLTGNEPGLASYWPMDVPGGLVAPDVLGGLSGLLTNMTASSWIDHSFPFYAQVGADLTNFADRGATPGFKVYTYTIAAFEDVNGDGKYTDGIDFESTIGPAPAQTNDGWRGFLSPPGNVQATDGQYADRVLVTWADNSQAESSYNIYRDNVLVGSVGADVTTFTYLTGDLTINQYCVAGVGGGVESVKGCDPGRAGGLAPPADVAATDTSRFENGDPTKPLVTFDDRIAVTWRDTTNTEDGFEVYRDNILLATTGPDTEEYNDFSAVQGQEYDYCVLAFSNADPLAPVRSVETCAPKPGIRVIVKDPTDLAATDAEFEDRVELRWKNPSTTAMLFMVYRDNALIEVLDYTMTATRDVEIPSDVEIGYCVTAATVTTSNAPAMQGRIAQVLSNIAMEDEVRKTTGEPVATLDDKIEAVRVVLGSESSSAANVLGIEGLEESDPVCDPGSRSILPASDVVASDNGFEDHVQVDWADNSTVETGYNIWRVLSPTDSTIIAVLSANRTTYGDYVGLPGQQYRYTVEAFDDYGNAKTDTDPGVRTLKPPSAFVASDGTSEMFVELDWKDNSSAEKGYRIYRVTGPSTYVLVDSTGKNEPAYTHTVATAQLGQDIEYEVRAFDLYGESLGARNTGNTMLEAPRNVNASNVYDDKIVVVWVDRSMVETSYEVTRREVGTSGATAVVGSPFVPDETNFDEVPPSSGKEYEYCVRATLNGFRSNPVCDIGLMVGATVTGPTGTQPTVITPVAGGNAEGVRFGTSLALDAGRAVIGAPGGGGANAGAGYQYAFSTDNVWSPNPERTLVTPQGAAFSEHGFSVDVEGNFAVVGNPFQFDDKFGEFRSYYLDAPLGNVNAFLAGAITGANNNDLQDYGISVAVADSFVIIGNDQHDLGNVPGFGSAVICQLREEAGKNCNQANTLPKLESLLTTTADDSQFGYAVDLTRVADSLFAIVGAPGAETAYVFGCELTGVFADNSCETIADWELLKELESSYGKNKQYGAAVAISDSYAAVGAPGAQGVLFWQRADGKWDVPAVVAAPVNKPSLGYGSSVALHGLILMVGAPGEQIADFENAGAAYIHEWDSGVGAFKPEIRYDARAGGTVVADALFGTAVDLDDNVYVVGAPGDGAEKGYVYSIPVDFEPPNTVIIPEGVALTTPEGIEATDGTAPDRIQVRWEDTSEDEDGHVVYRSNTTGDYDRVGKTAANVEFFDDFEAAPGESYTYCVTAFFGASETERACDIGWRPPNGTIGGRIAVKQGGGTEGATVCLVPSPNKALIFDGAQGQVLVPLGEDLDFNSNFTVEAWVRPEADDRIMTVVAKDRSFAVRINGTALELGLDETTFVASTKTVTMGQWNHIAVSVDLNADIRFSVGDGTEELIAGGATGLILDGDSLTIGNSRIGVLTPFVGGIDEVRIWSRGRSNALIDSLKFSPFTGEEENLVGYWPLDDGLRRIVPDITELANHGQLIAGVYLADDGAELEICGTTSDEGNYSIANIRYGESTEFNVIPTRPDREFSPSFKKITLQTESPVQNEVFFTDVTAYGISGLVQYVSVVPTVAGPDTTLFCPVPEVVIHAGKTDLATDDNVKGKTRADGSYSISVDPSIDERDLYYFIPELTDAVTGVKHTFDAVSIDSAIFGTKYDYNFADMTKFTLTGNFSGGDPEMCHQNIGTAILRIRTQDGCFDQKMAVNSQVNAGAFSFNLPPQKYLLEVDTVDVSTLTPERAADVQAFFAKLGAVEIDLTKGNAKRNLIYRAPLTLQIDGLQEDAAACTANGGFITQLDEDGAVLRTLRPVRVIGEDEFVPLTITLMEDYGDGTDPALMCGVEDGTVTIFDSIADRVDVDSTVALVDGVANYTTVGVSPNIFAGARIAGVDRSFQKPLTAVAKVEGRDALITTEWALVEGYRERAATFVSATTEEFPLLILHDPPGSNSYAFIEKGNTVCNRISNTKMFGGAGGLDLDIIIGLKAGAGFSFGAHFDVVAGVGAYITTRTLFGREDESLDGNNMEICVTTNETFTTSSDQTWVGEDIFMGVALNLIFALADVLESNECKLELSEIIATDLDNADPFETIYTYGKSHIALSLIPELENLIRIGGDATLNGQINGQDETVGLQEAVDNWKDHLKLNDDLTDQGIAASTTNRSFSGGTEFSHVESVDSTEVTALQKTKIYIDSQSAVGLAISVGYDQKIGVAFDIKSEWNSESETTEQSSQSIGYVLSDGDTGDYFTVDVGDDPRYGTKVFRTLSGRSSNPHEANTQGRDRPELAIDPPIALDASPDGTLFTLTLTNANDSRERREYVLAISKPDNPGSAFISITGDPIDGDLYLVDGGTAQEISLLVQPGPSRWVYEDLAMIVYPEKEYEIWQADPRQPFALSDTVFFTVQFDSTGNAPAASLLAEGWNWISINRDGGDIDSVLNRHRFDHGDLIRGQKLWSRYDSTQGWVGDLAEVNPGEGYRLKVQRSGVLRFGGEVLETADPVSLTEGWNWVGYLPKKKTHIAEALESIGKKVIQGDAVVGQDGFAQYVNGVGWVGTLTDMAPGKSYAMYLSTDAELLYPLEPTNENRPEIPIREITILGPEWKVNSQDYTTGMTVVAEVRMGGVPIEHTAMKIAVFADDEIRGTGEVHYVEALDKYLAFIMINGEFDEEKEMVVHAFDGEADALYEKIATINFAAQDMIGQPARPVVLDLSLAGQAPELVDLPEVMALHPNYPNPFNKTSTIAYDLPEATDVSIVVFDLLGRRVANLVDGEQAAGRHKATFDGRRVASGIYFYRMRSGDFEEVGKMVLIK